MLSRCSLQPYEAQLFLCYNLLELTPHPRLAKTRTYSHMSNFLTPTPRFWSPKSEKQIFADFFFLGFLCFWGSSWVFWDFTWAFDGFSWFGGVSDFWGVFWFFGFFPKFLSAITIAIICFSKIPSPLIVDPDPPSGRSDLRITMNTKIFLCFAQYTLFQHIY